MENQENNKLAELEKKSEEYLNNWKRSAADFINYKKEEIQRAGMLVNYAKEDVFLNLLPIIDSIYLAEKSIAGSDLAIAEGVGAIKKQITEFLKKEGIEEVLTLNQKFNPETMEIMEEVEGGDQGMVAEEVQKGYKMGDKVLRPAKVKVGK